jgi:hypothetical protein
VFIWYIFLVLVSCAKKNLATLVADCTLRCFDPPKKNTQHFITAAKVTQRQSASTAGTDAAERQKAKLLSRGILAVETTCLDENLKD